MKFVGTGAVLSESEKPPRNLKDSMASALTALEDAAAELQRLDTLHENTEKQCQNMLAAARSQAEQIVAAAQRKADEIRERVRKFEEAVRPIAKSIVGASEI
jgi:F0F1-type ATP synthase membrane subunit b/b'